VHASQRAVYLVYSIPEPTPLTADSFEMVQTYGVARENDDHTNHVAGTGEESALLGGDATVKRQTEGHATLTSCVSNLSNTIIGTGKCLADYIADDR
jgi:hypothetical protein